MKNDTKFALSRSQATITVATAIGPDWLWSELSLAGMTTQRTALKTQADATDTLEVAFNDAVAGKNTAFAAYHASTVALLSMVKTHFRKDARATALLKNLHAKGNSEQDILDEGSAFAKVWARLDGTYVPDTGWTLQAFKDAGTDCATKRDAAGTAEVAWSDQDKITDGLTAGVRDFCVAWYSDATHKFGPDTPHGQLIRSQIPTSYVPASVPGQVAIIEAQAVGAGKIHIDFNAPGAASVTVLHQGPGAAGYATFATGVTGSIYEASGLAAGTHRFKLVGVDSAGEGPESDEIVLNVS